MQALCGCSNGAMFASYTHLKKGMLHTFYGLDCDWDKLELVTNELVTNETMCFVFKFWFQQKNVKAITGAVFCCGVLFQI